MSEPVVAIVVAAGLGVRFGGRKPKPTLHILGKAVVGMAVEGLAAGGCTHAVVVINQKAAGLFRTALAAAPIPVAITPGGSSRQESVRMGLEVVRKDPVLSKARTILVHDSVRPMVPAYVTASVISAIRQGAVAVAPGVEVNDSVRRITDDGTTTVVDRSQLRAIQTPQGFDSKVLLESHDAMAEAGREFTDDLSCVEALGYRVTLVPGSRLGIKITEPADLTIARALWRARASFGHHSGRRFWRLLGDRRAG